MHTFRLSLGALLAIAITLPSLEASADASELSEVTASEYYAAAYFKDAQENPKLSKLSRSAQINAVARDLNMKPKKLQAALEKVEAVGAQPDEIAKLAEAAIKKAVEKTRVKGKVLDVLINMDEPKHVVMYVRWQGTSSRDVVKEASTIASLVAAETPLVSTLSLAAIHPKAAESSKDAVWSGKISSQSMSKIQKQRIDDYGDRLYKGLFEGVDEKPF